MASSVEHASEIIQILRNKLHQSAVIVTYKQQAPSDMIEQFRHDQTQWIVSVGMVSEGTDIPRLQVCCHLSRVKTELYFRQVLGRILRVNNAINQQAWLYTFAEPQLTEFALRIEQDLPDIPVIIREFIDNTTITQGITKEIEDKKAADVTDLNFEFDNVVRELITNTDCHLKSSADGYENALSRSFEILGGFRDQVIDTFDSPFQEN